MLALLWLPRQRRRPAAWTWTRGGWACSSPRCSPCCCPSWRLG
ncbi:hypothetical protein QJS66_08770 [Kocuria rhizophila]|nr:hypothetical protein QJS66_08770 [Kocuria rhizophila]